MSAPDEPVIARTQSNRLGMAGFVCAVVGSLTCGVLSPLALVFSAIALFKRPRGLAIAGTVLGLIGSLWLAFFGVALVLGMLGLRVAEEIATTDSLRDAAMRIDEYEGEHGAYPSQEEGQRIIQPYTDDWGNALRYAVVAGGAYTIISSGRDGTFGTADDLRFGPSDWKISGGSDDLDDLFD